ELICHHTRLSKTWRNRVDGNTSRGEFLRQSFRILFQRTFTAKISRRTGKTQMGSIGRNVHDAATVFKYSGRFLHREVRTLGVQGDDLIEVSLGGLHDGLRHKPSGIVDEDVESAELLYRLDHEATHLCDSAHVRLNGDGLPTLSLDVCHDLPGFFHTCYVIHHHNRPVLGQSFCDRLSNSPGRPGDDRHFSAERCHHVSFAFSNRRMGDGCSQVAEYTNSVSGLRTLG